MSSLYTIMTLLVVMVLLGAVVATSIGFQQHAFAKPQKEGDPCKAFKELAKYIEKAGLLAVATGNENEMSNLIDDFEDYSEAIIEASPPDKGKC